MYTSYHTDFWFTFGRYTNLDRGSIVVWVAYIVVDGCNIVSMNLVLDLSVCV